MEWLNILESYFNQRQKAFLIFDNNNVLQYISDYARDILEFDDTLMGFVTLNELFPSPEKNPQFLVDANYSFQPIYDILYMTPSGRSKELRINRDTGLQSIGDMSGYIVWIEAKSRDITAVYRKVSSLDPYRELGWLFDEFKLGYILINKEGIIEKSNDKIREYISEPGEWRGRNIYTFPFIHQHGITSLIMKSLKKDKNKRSIDVSLKYPNQESPLNLKWSALPLTDLEGSIVGAIIIVSAIRELI
jgi:PAS domain-containing protein